MNSENPTNLVTSLPPIKHVGKKHSLRTTLSIVTVMVLIVGVFSAVTLSLQSQDSRTRASGYTSYSNYYTTYQGTSGSYGSYSGLLPCINVVVVVIGNCGSSQPAPQPVPCGYTATPTQQRTGSTLVSVGSNIQGSIVSVGSTGTNNTSYNPAPTLPCPTPTTPYVAPTVPPYVAPTAAPTAPPYTAPTTPYSEPTPTAAPAYGSGNVTATLKVYLHGIGNGGDNVNPTSQGNMTPVHTQRTASVQVYNTSNQLVSDNQATLNYDGANGVFKGEVTLTGVETGAYTIKIKTDQYLRALVSGIQSLTKGQAVTLPEVRLIAGDVNGDNQVNILDYNVIIGCYSDLSPATSCTPENNLKSDINDDGHVNQYDYNLFIRELSSVSGQ